MQLDTPATIQERTHTHYIYTYKGREAAGVGGHAVQEITTRGHPAQTHMRAKKRIMQLMRARLSVLPVMGAEAMAQTRHPKPYQLPRRYLVAAQEHNRPDRPRTAQGTPPDRPRRYLVAAHDPDHSRPPLNRTGHTPEPSRL